MASQMLAGPSPLLGHVIGFANSHAFAAELETGCQLILPQFYNAHFYC
jgi:hypothetical protein